MESNDNQIKRKGVGNMCNVKIRVDRPDKYGIIKATIVKYGYSGSIDEKYLSKRQHKEIMEYGYTHIIQPKERVI